MESDVSKSDHEWPEFVHNELAADDTEFNPVSGRVVFVADDGTEIESDALIERLPGFKGDRVYFPDDSPVPHSETYAYESEAKFRNSTKEVGAYVVRELHEPFAVLRDE